MIIAIIITAVASFLICGTWEYFAHKKRNDMLALVIVGMLNDMRKMSSHLGYNDLFTYYRHKEGEEYARNVESNIINTLKTLNKEDLLN